MSFDYAASAADASELLREFGQTVTLSRTTEPVYDPITGEYTGGGTVTASALAVLLPVGDDAGKQFGENGVVRVDDRKVIVEAGAAVDELTTLTDAGGLVWTFVNVTVLAPAGTVVLYKGFARK